MAMQRARLQPGEIAGVFWHGTGTRSNDAAEAEAAIGLNLAGGRPARLRAVRPARAWWRRVRAGGVCGLNSGQVVRGGIFTNVVAEHRKPGWQPAPRVDLSSFDSESNIRG